jgi:cGMP-dependent protein kinase
MGVSCSYCCEKEGRVKDENDAGDLKRGNSEGDPSGDGGAAGDSGPGQQRGGVRKGNANRIGKRVDTQAVDGERLQLENHKRHRSKGLETKKLIRKAMKQDRVCAMLEEREIETILETMEYFEWNAKDSVVKQGDVGTTFFVTHEGSMEVTVNEKVVNTMGRGMAFGGLALLYNCPRTASVTSVTTCSAWGANGGTFHKVLQENAKKSYSENRKFLDSIQLFNGLPEKQKDRIGEAFFNEVFQTGARVVTEGEAPTAMYFIKSGSLRVVTKAQVSADGKVSGGTEIAKMSAGECFGERALLSGEVRAATIVSEERSELLCIGGDQLREVLGGDLRTCLEQVVVLACLKKSPIISQFSSHQQYAIMKAVQIKDFKAREKVPGGLRFGVICDGDIDGKNKGRPIKLGRGGWFEQDTLLEESPGTKAQIQHRKTFGTDVALQSLADSKGGMTDLSASAGGARIGCLTDDVFARTLKSLGLGQMANAEQAEDYTRKIILVKKVQLFRHLSQEACDKLVTAFVLEKFTKNQYVFKQGEQGNKFYVIASGEVGIWIGDKLIRTMPRNQFFGERALLFDEARTASVQVSTNEAELWSVDKSVFKTIITQKMQQELQTKIKLQDTNVTMKDLKHIKVIGAGAAGTVRLVEHKKNKTRYALKRVRKENGKIPEEVTRECSLLGENDHPFIMHLVKTFETKDSVYMLTELITGGELHAAIRTIPTVLSRAQCQFYGGSVVLVLEELHERNIVYRDLKPENVMLDAQGYLKLIDFGIAKKLEEGKTRTFTMIGTPHYMAPEVMRGHGYGTEVDIWSFGVMCFEFVCGYLPFADDLDDPTEVCTAVLKDSLAFPSGYKDQLGRTLMTGLLTRSPKKRLGAGMNGFEDIKNADYFKAGHDKTSVFSKILGRELDPPVQPPREVYSEDVDGVTLSDQGELG